MSASEKGEKRKSRPAAEAAATPPAEPLSVGRELVSKSTEGIRKAERSDVSRARAHRHGHNPDEEVRSLAHIYSPWANVRANGSGIVALAAWAKRLEEEAADRTRSAGRATGDFVRGLTHR